MTEEEIFQAYYQQEFASLFGPYDADREVCRNIKADILKSLGYATFRMDIRIHELAKAMLPGVSSKAARWIFYLLWCALVIIVVNFAEAVLSICIKLFN